MNRENLPKKPLPRRRRGSVVLEAVMVLPVLLLLVFGTIEFAWAFHVKHVLQGAARQGARAAIVPGATNRDVSDAVADAMDRFGLGGDTFTVSVRDGKKNAAIDVSRADEGDAMLVEVKAPWSQYSVMAGGFGSGAITGDLTGQAVMRREG